MTRNSGINIGGWLVLFLFENYSGGIQNKLINAAGLNAAFYKDEYEIVALSISFYVQKCSLF